MSLFALLASVAEEVEGAGRQEAAVVGPEVNTDELKLKGSVH